MSNPNSLDKIDSNKSKQISIISTNPLNLNKIIKKTVLDEDTYIKDLETIIERDFFPDLEKLKVQKDYLEALKNNDRLKLYELYSKYSIHRVDPRQTQRTTGFDTPSTFETPEIRPRDSQKHDKQSPERPYSNEEPPIKKLASDDTLDKYLAKNTSEDNLSFETIMSEAEKKERTKLHKAWLYEQEKRILKNQEATLAIPSIEQQAIEVNTGKLESWGYTMKNSLMYAPEGVDLTFEEKLRIEKQQLVIKHENTRFSKFPFDMNAAASAAASGKKFGQLNAKLGIDGKELASDETPKINGYGFVAAMPSPAPGQLAGDESPMMTWGEIEGTPFRLDASNTPLLLHGGGGPEFKIPDVPEREKIALDLEEKANAARRKRKAEALKCVQRSLTHSPRSSDSPTASLSDRINVMSPAAQRLLSSKLNIRPNSSSKSSRSTTPINSPFSSPITTPGSASFKSPSRTRTSVKVNLKQRSSIDSLTDNLLKLPKQN